jgi:hypothetical protein
MAELSYRDTVGTLASPCKHAEIRNRATAAKTGGYNFIAMHLTWLQVGKASSSNHQGSSLVSFAVLAARY